MLDYYVRYSVIDCLLPYESLSFYLYYYLKLN